MKNIFQRLDADRPVRSQHLNNLKVPRVNQETFGTNSLTSLDPKIWNNLPIHLNGLVSLVEFERVILIGSFLSLLGSTSAGQCIIYPVGGRWVGAFSRWVGGSVVLQ